METMQRDVIWIDLMHKKCSPDVIFSLFPFFNPIIIIWNAEIVSKERSLVKFHHVISVRN